jgi:hypothetical protein
VQAEIRADRGVLILTVPAFMAEDGPGVPREAHRRLCTVTLNVEHPADWQFAIARVRFGGLADLDAQVKGSVLSSYFFQGAPTVVTFPDPNLTGPVVTGFEFRFDLPKEAVQFGPCGGGRSLVIGSEARVNPTEADANATGQLTLGQGDTAVLNFGLIWREC